MIVLKYLFLILFFFINFTNFSNSSENKILFKINNEIITTIDISNEINYLKAINSEIKKLDKNSVIGIAKNSLIKDKIKQIELNKNIDEITIDEEYSNFLIKSTYSKIGFNNIDQFINHLNSHNVEINTVKEKIILDITWKRFLYTKYKNKIKIDKNKISQEILNKKNKIFQLSEIVFDIKKNEKVNEKFNLIKKSIDNDGFKNAALKYSVSDTSKAGGDLGWINASAISSKILNNLSLINKNEYTKPIRVPSGFLILKINDVKKEKVQINIEEEIQKVINLKINEQLNQFSNLYINKVKKNIIINEL